MPRSHSIQQPAKHSSAKQHNPRANRTIHGRKFDADGKEVKKIIAHAEAPVIERWLRATCLRCLQAHIPVPEDGGGDDDDHKQQQQQQQQQQPRGKDRRRFWCSQRPATKRERSLFVRNLRRLGEMDAADELERRGEESVEAGAQGLEVESLFGGGGGGGIGRRAKARSVDEGDSDSENDDGAAAAAALDNKALNKAPKNPHTNNKQRYKKKFPAQPPKPTPEEAAADAQHRDAMRAARRALRVVVAGDADDAVELARDRTAVFPSDCRPVRVREPYLDAEAMMTFDDIRRDEPVYSIRVVAAKKGRGGGKGRQEKSKKGGEGPAKVEAAAEAEAAAEEMDEDYEFVDGEDDWIQV
jgi:hypothetical protein